MNAKPIWRMVQDAARELTREGVVPFTRVEMIEKVHSHSPKIDANSINPIIQGLTDNLKGGAPGADGKRVLHSVGRGKFVLYSKRDEQINQEPRKPESTGPHVRQKQSGGLVEDGFSKRATRVFQPSHPPQKNHDLGALSEDEVKDALAGWLADKGWSTEIAWGRQQGIDIDAKRGKRRWIIEVKGPGSRPQMRINYFLAILGETLQRMDDPSAKYSIALPDLPQYRGLWKRLPDNAKKRTGISMLFISLNGQIEEVS